MFVENYRLDTLVGGWAQSGIPYAKISDDDWPKWKAFLPVKSEVICKKAIVWQAKGFPSNRLRYSARCLPRDDARSQTFRGDRSLGQAQDSQRPHRGGTYWKWRALSNLPLGNG